MQEVKQTLESREVAEMIGKEHNKLLRDIRRYLEQLNEANWIQ
ncbi:MAG: Rha family transcriptional regulator [Lachnospiraceae bacterium]|nr:Rha family transcriptional regulator [Lachnospiraceae bacterium]